MNSHQTADATSSYRETSGTDIVRATSAASEGTISSFSRNNTLIFARTFYVAPLIVEQEVHLPDTDPSVIFDFAAD